MKTVINLLAAFLSACTVATVASALSYEPTQITPVAGVLIAFTTLTAVVLGLIFMDNYSKVTIEEAIKISKTKAFKKAVAFQDAVEFTRKNNRISENIDITDEWLAQRDENRKLSRDNEQVDAAHDLMNKVAR